MQENDIKYTRCLKCNKILKTERAKQRGYGDICWKQYLSEMRNNSNKLLVYLNQTKEV